MKKLEKTYRLFYKISFIFSAGLALIPKQSMAIIQMDISNIETDSMEISFSGTVDGGQPNFGHNWLMLVATDQGEPISTLDWHSESVDFEHVSGSASAPALHWLVQSNQSAWWTTFVFKSAVDFNGQTFSDYRFILDGIDTTNLTELSLYWGWDGRAQKGTHQSSVAISPVPEPSFYGLLLGLTGLGIAIFRRRFR